MIDGNVVVVTGASRGIGAATARVLAERGAKVVVGARSTNDLQALADSYPDAIAPLAADVTRREDVQALVDLAVERFGRLDAFVANAGVGVIAPLSAVDVDDWNWMIDVNLRGVLHGIAAAVPVFLRQGSGHFVTITSVATTDWVPGQGVYVATKAGVRALCEVLRKELAPERIRATMVCPGFTKTDFVESFRPEQRIEFRARRDEVAMPSEAVAEAVLFCLAQPEDIDVGELVVRPTLVP
jgi:NADP-dependent 3-hydroxy acid dehydrogenase YdfG